MRNVFVLLLTLAAIILTIGCTNDSTEILDKETPVEEEADFKPLIERAEKLVIKKRIGTENKYETFQEITDKVRVNQVLDILQNADWENIEVEMASLPDYKINNKYGIWLTPQKNLLEVVIMQGNRNYAKLSEKDSHSLYEIMTDKKLGE